MAHEHDMSSDVGQCWNVYSFECPCGAINPVRGWIQDCQMQLITIMMGECSNGTLLKSAVSGTVHRIHVTKEMVLVQFLACTKLACLVVQVQSLTM